MTRPITALRGTLRLGLAICAALPLMTCESGAAGPVFAPPVISAIQCLQPITRGTELTVAGDRFYLFDSVPELVLKRDGIETIVPPSDEDDPERFHYRIGDNALTAFSSGAGPYSVRLRALAGTQTLESAPFSFAFTVANAIELRLEYVTEGRVHHGAELSVRGEGFLSESEGATLAHFVGEFTNEADEIALLDVRLPVAVTSRTEGRTKLASTLGGVQAGTFRGRVSLESNGIASVQTPARAISLSFAPVAFETFETASATLGQYVIARGAGFVDDARADTLLRLTGTVRDGTESRALDRVFAVEVPDHQHLRFGLEYEPNGDIISSRLFNCTRCVFTGTATVILSDGATTSESVAVPVQFTVQGIKQVVHVVFLPGFYRTVERFGLTNAVDVVISKTLDRFRRIYADYNVEPRLQAPTDFDPQYGYAVIEVGGPDPSGRGYFGLDNSLEIDRNNLRLADRVGGASMIAGRTSRRSFGGVFMESYLWYSATPDLRGPRPLTQPKPLFDVVFNPVRQNPPTPSEVRGESENATRNAQVARAIRALSSMLGETVSHEFGHTLGMALASESRCPTCQGGPDPHTRDGPGCLMDTGDDRDLPERMEEPGAPMTHFCYDAPEYLERLLPKD